MLTEDLQLGRSKVVDITDKKIIEILLIKSFSSVLEGKVELLKYDTRNH